MSTQHVKILYIQRTPTTREKVVDLAIIIEKEHALFSDFFTSKIVCFEFDI